MEPVSVLFAPLQELFIKFLKRGNDWDRDKCIAAAVANLVLYIALFVAGSRIAKISPENAVEHKSGKAVCQNTLTVFQYLSNSRGHIVKAQSDGNTPNVLKNPLHAYPQALLVLGLECLRYSVVRSGEI